MGTIDELFHGCIDLHAHMGPDPYRERRFDAVQLAIDAKAAGMGGLVMKSHEYCTAPLVCAIGQFVKGIGLFGCVALNTALGGINPEAAEVAARLGAKILWMPTHSGKEISAFDDGGRLIPQVYDVLDIVRQFDMALATGHLNRAESFAVIDAAREKGIEKIIYTHAMLAKLGEPLSIEGQVEAVRRGVFIEHCAFSLMPTGERMAPEAMAEAIKTVGAAHCILSSDLGQHFTSSPSEGMRVIISSMLLSGIGKDDIEIMVKTNPAQLLGLQ